VPSEVVASGRPFLRWAGSKRWLVPHIGEYLPSSYGNYYEPFLGSGSVFFALHANGREHYLSDGLAPLVNCYRQVSDNPDAVRLHIESFETSSEAYYALRLGQDMGATARAAAEFIYFNRLGFNGLYRVNLQGRYNVPYGRARQPVVLGDTDDLAACAAVLRQGVHLSHSDFADALAGVKEHDLVYLDPPYVAGHRRNGFVDYNARVFRWSDQERLARLVEEMSEKGAFVLMSNADHESIRDLYPNSSIVELSRFSSMAGAASAREKSAELLIVNQPLKERLGWLN